MQFGDYAAWQSEICDLEAPEYRNMAAWWADRLRDVPPRPSRTFRSADGAVLAASLDNHIGELTFSDLKFQRYELLKPPALPGVQRSTS